MLALCLMLSETYYAQNYAGMIGLGLNSATFWCKEIEDRQNYECLKFICVKLCKIH